MAWHVIELTRVTDEDLADAMNRSDREGWLLRRVDYVTQPGVKRPVMAFLFFSSPDPADAGEGASPTFEAPPGAARPDEDA